MSILTMVYNRCFEWCLNPCSRAVWASNLYRPRPVSFGCAQRQILSHLRTSQSLSIYCTHVNYLQARIPEIVLALMPQATPLSEVRSH